VATSRLDAVMPSSSIKLIRRVLDSSLPSHLKLVLAALVVHGDSDGRNIFPSMPAVGDMASISERQAIANVQSLISMGLLAADEATRSYGRGQTRRYRFNPDLLPAPCGVSAPRRLGEHLWGPQHQPAKRMKPTSPFVADKRVKSTAKRMKSSAEKDEAHFTRSTRDLPGSVRTSASRKRSPRVRGDASMSRDAFSSDRHFSQNHIEASGGGSNPSRENDLESNDAPYLLPAGWKEEWIRANTEYWNEKRNEETFALRAGYMPSPLARRLSRLRVDLDLMPALQEAA